MDRRASAPSISGATTASSSSGTGPLGETFRAKIYGVAGFEKQFAVKRLHAAAVRRRGASSRASSTPRPPSPRSSTSGIARVHEVNAQGAHYYIAIDLVRGLDLRTAVRTPAGARRGAAAPTSRCHRARHRRGARARARADATCCPAASCTSGSPPPSVMVTYEATSSWSTSVCSAALMRPGWSRRRCPRADAGYLAPELLRAEGVDARADVFSLGVVLHELLGGGRVFLSDRAAELRKAIESGPPAPPACRSAAAAHRDARARAGAGAAIRERRGDADGHPGDCRRAHRPGTSGPVGSCAAVGGASRAADGCVRSGDAAAGGDGDDVAGHGE